MQLFGKFSGIPCTVRRAKSRKRQPSIFLSVELLEQRLVLAADGLNPILLFAPGTPDEYVDQFRQTDATEGSIGQFRLDDRWVSTATDGQGGAGSIGTPITVTWSIVRDGVSVQGFAGEATSPSNLVGSFRAIYGIANNPADTNYQEEAWFEAIESTFDRWSEISGIGYVYEPNDDGASFAFTAGVLGVRGDVRIAGHTIDGNSGTLAYNFFPDTSDMVLDTADSFYASTGGNSLRLRNVVAHEAGHGFGLSHVTSNNASFLLEPFINLGFDGPQLDDILGVQRGYGDVNESGSGNNSSAAATGLGTLLSGQSVTIGVDANDTFVAATDIDFVSIDDDSDVDFYSFVVNTSVELDATLTPLGPTYLEGPQNGGQSNYDTSAFSNLTLQVIDTNGSTILANANNTGLGGTEALDNVALAAAGTYFVRVSGANNAVQLYQLTLTATQTQANPGVTVVQSNGSTNITESGNTDTYTLVLDSPPTANVTININSDGELDSNVAAVTFTPGNWNAAQTVTVAAVDDDDVEGNHSGTITHSATSTDSAYDGISVASVTASITDNDSIGVTVSQSNGSTNVAEGGNGDTYTLVLDSPPSASVTVNIVTDDELDANVGTVTFSTGNWNVAQTISVAAVDDNDAEGNHSGTITHSTSSGDPNYNGISVASVTANITDNDIAGVTVTQSNGSTNVAEGGNSDTYTLVLDSQPGANVTINLNSDVELNSDVASATFTPGNWNVAQTVTVSAVDDEDVEGNHSGTITHSATSGDAGYNGISIAAVTASISDNDEGEESQDLYLSFKRAGSAGSVQFQNEDIISFDGENFSLLFDGSDVGLSGLAIDAFDVLNETDILLSFTAPSGGVDDSDIILFRATSLGDNTSGGFFWYFDASDVGLSRGSEDIDAVTLLDDGSLLLSTVGRSGVPGLSFRDEDIVRFTPTNLGSNTIGTFQMLLDGSDANVGLSGNRNEDVDGLAVEYGKLYLTTVGNFSVPGVSGADEDVFVFDYSTGTYDSNLFVDFNSNDLRGLDFAGTASLGGPSSIRFNLGELDSIDGLVFFGQKTGDSGSVYRRSIVPLQRTVFAVHSDIASAMQRSYGNNDSRVVAIHTLVETQTRRATEVLGIHDHDAKFSLQAHSVEAPSVVVFGVFSDQILLDNLLNLELPNALEGLYR